MHSRSVEVARRHRAAVSFSHLTKVSVEMPWRIAWIALALLVILNTSLSASWLSEITGIDIDLRSNSVPAPLPPPATAPADTDPKVRAAFIGAQVAYYQTYAETLKHSQASGRYVDMVFAWQVESSRVLFWVVIAIVLSGLLLCWLQFLKGWRRRPTAAGELEISAGGVKISSPVLGLLVLAISLTFFYLFLFYVYPIRVIELPRTDRQDPSVPRSLELPRAK
jgi:hypothetical protein